MSKKFAFGAIIGMVAGIVAGVLTAPKSGKETRDEIKARAQELKDKAVELSDDAIATADKLKEQGVQAFEDAKNGIKK
ncbi:MAG: YtxH domain-containing protein [Candidatus Saccharimonadales bacterium]